MRKFEWFLLLASIGLAAFGTYTLGMGLFDGQLCYKKSCSTPKDNAFFAYAFLYIGMIAFGLISAWRSKKNIAYWRGLEVAKQSAKT